MTKYWFWCFRDIEKFVTTCQSGSPQTSQIRTNTAKGSRIRFGYCLVWLFGESLSGFLFHWFVSGCVIEIYILIRTYCGLTHTGSIIGFVFGSVLVRDLFLGTYRFEKIASRMAACWLRSVLFSRIKEEIHDRSLLQNVWSAWATRLHTHAHPHVAIETNAAELDNTAGTAVDLDILGVCLEVRPWRFGS